MGPRIDGFGIRIDLISPAKRNIASNCVRVISFLARSKSPIWGGSPQTNKVVRFPWFCARADFAKNTRISRSWKAVPSRRNAFSTFDGRSKVIQQIPRDRPRRRRHMGSSISSIFPHELKCENISFRFTVYFKPFTKTTVFTTSSGCCTSCWDSKSFKGWMGSALLGGCVCPTCGLGLVLSLRGKELKPGEGTPFIRVGGGMGRGAEFVFMGELRTLVREIVGERLVGGSTIVFVGLGCGSRFMFSFLVQRLGDPHISSALSFLGWVFRIFWSKKSDKLRFWNGWASGLRVRMGNWSGKELFNIIGA